jgi:mono/diheme cytochrome c family protein
MLRRWIRRLAATVAIAIAITALAWGGLHWHTQRLLDVADAPDLAALPAGDAVEGERLARVLGCSGCHDQDLGGKVVMAIPRTARLVASNLTQARRRYDDAAFQRLLRTGAKADGRLALMMPNKAFQRLDDRQVADVLAYVRSVPAVERELPPTWLGPLARLGVVLGEYQLDDIRADPPESPAVLADRLGSDRGRHLAQVACGECHGMDLNGWPQDGVPALHVAKAYSASEFERLLSEGITKAGGDSATGMMSAVARYRFSALRGEEIDALKTYLDRY